MKTIYVLSPEIKWKTFKKLQEKLVRDEGPTPEHGNKTLWQMLRDKQIYCWFDPKDMPWDMGVGLEIPKNVKKLIITNANQETTKKT